MKPIILFFLLSTVAYSQNNPNTLLGYPDSAGFIINRPQYVISYCGELNSARWASWFVDKNSYGKVGRTQNNFLIDTALPPNYTTVRHADYTNSGYDRGHLVRSEDRTKTVEDNKATFFLNKCNSAIPEPESWHLVKIRGLLQKPRTKTKQATIHKSRWFVFRKSAKSK